MAPRVSVVMPVFNGERFVAEAVESVLASRFTDLELLLLIDAGTTDCSAAVAAHAAAGDVRVRMIHHPHVVPSVARNIGLKEARGDLIANLDCDDAMFPDRLSRQIAYLDRHADCVAVGSRALVVDANNTPLTIGVRDFSHEQIDRAHLEGRAGSIMNPTATFRREVALAVGGYSEDLPTVGEDFDLWLRMAEAGRLANLPEVLVRYRTHDKNASVGDAGKEQRRAVTLSILRRTFARRGITDREPAQINGPPRRAWERWSNRALLHYFSGDWPRATAAALVGIALRPSAIGGRAALGTVFSGPPPQWRRPARSV
jgi:GT2 family glycosyltransferase